MSVPNVFTLSLMATMATWACSAAFCVSPPSELMSAALKLVTCSMYWLAETPAASNAPLALASTVPCAVSSACHSPATSPVVLPFAAAYSSRVWPMLPNSFWTPPTFCS